MTNSFRNSEPDVEIIVRTLAEGSRADLLLRALDSIQSQNGVHARAIVVVNGDRYDQNLVDQVKKRADVTYSYLKEGSLIKSRLHGRDLVRAPFFAFLDDDDVLVENSLRDPLAWLQTHQDDVVITRTDMSFHNSAKRQKAPFPPFESPLSHLMRECWLHPGAGFFRTTTIDKKILNVPYEAMEWTRIAFGLLLAGKRIHFMDMDTVIYYDTEASMSKSVAHHEAELRLLNEIMSHSNIDSDIRRRVREKYANALHILAGIYRLEGRSTDAWKMHLKSLGTARGFLKYILYTRKMVFPRTS